jgi:hypothetical protein
VLSGQTPRNPPCAVRRLPGPQPSRRRRAHGGRLPLPVPSPRGRAPRQACTRPGADPHPGAAGRPTACAPSSQRPPARARATTSPTASGTTGGPPTGGRPAVGGSQPRAGAPPWAGANHGRALTFRAAPPRAPHPRGRPHPGSLTQACRHHGRTPPTDADPTTHRGTAPGAGPAWRGSSGGPPPRAARRSGERGGGAQGDTTLRSYTRRSPMRVSQGSCVSMIDASFSTSGASPPVAMTVTSSGSSASSRAMRSAMPSA